MTQVEHAVALNQHVGVREQVQCVHRPEVAFAGPEHDGYDVHADLVDQAGRKHLATHVASGDLDDAVTVSSWALATAATTPSTKWNGAPVSQPSGCGRWVTTTTWSIPLGGVPSQPSVRSKTWRPAIVTPIWSQ